MKKLIRFKNDENGIALIFSLAILALFLLSFLTFSFKSRLESRIARNTLQRITGDNQVDQLARGIISFIKNYDSNLHDDSDSYPPVSFEDLTMECYKEGTVTSLGGSVTFKGLVSQQVTTASGKTTNEGIVDALSLDLIDDFHYKINPGTLNLGWNLKEDISGNVVARSAWMLISRDNSINPLAEQLNIESPFSVNVFDYINALPGVAGAGTVINNWNNYSTYLKYPIEEEFYDNSLMSLVLTDTQKVNYYSYLLKYFYPFHENTELVDNLHVEPIEHQGAAKYLHHSFVGGTMTPYVITDSSTPDDMTDSVTGIPHLAFWPDSEKGNYATGLDRGKQIAANIIDLLDADSMPTQSAGATYFGIEDVPHISEIGARVTVRPLVMKEDVGAADLYSSYDSTTMSLILNTGTNIADYTANVPIVDDDGEVQTPLAPRTPTSNDYIIISPNTGEWNFVYEDVPGAGTVEARGFYHFGYYVNFIFELYNFYQSIPFQTVDTNLDGIAPTRAHITGKVQLNSSIENINIINHAVEAIFTTPYTNSINYKQLREEHFFSFRVQDDDVTSPVGGINDLQIEFPNYISLEKFDGTSNFDRYDYILSLPISPVYASTIDESNNNVGVGWRTNDPRVNLHPTDWIATGDIDDGNSSLPIMTVENVPLSLNAICANPITLTANSDHEPSLGSTNIPLTYSSSFSATRNVRGFTEGYHQLGGVNRGEPWQSLNFSEYNYYPSDTNRNYKGSSLFDLSLPYTSIFDGGDANILEQIDLSAFTIARDVIESPTNINTSNLDLLEKIIDTSFIDNPIDVALHLNSFIGLAYPGDSEHLFVFDELYALQVRGILKKYFGDNNTSLALGNNGYIQDRLATMMVNLSNSRYNYYTLIVTVQQIKEIPLDQAEAEDFMLDATSSGRIISESKVKINFSQDTQGSKTTKIYNYIYQ